MAAMRVQPDEERELVRRAAEGDREAFGRLVALHQHEVYTLALRLVGSRDLAWDVSQESFIRAWRAVQRFRGDSAFGTWLHRITVNAAWTLQKRAARHAAASIDHAADVVDDRSSSPESAALRAVASAELHSALAAMPAAARTVVVLKDVYDWSHAEISDHLGISITAAKVRLHRARRMLRALLETQSGWGGERR